MVAPISKKKVAVKIDGTLISTDDDESSDLGSEVGSKASGAYDHLHMPNLWDIGFIIICWIAMCF